MSIVQGSYTHRVWGSTFTGFYNCFHHLLVPQWPSHVIIIFKNTGIWSIYLSFCSTYVYTMKSLFIFHPIGTCTTKCALKSLDKKKLYVYQYLVYRHYDLSYLSNFFIAFFNVFCGANNNLFNSVNIFLLQKNPICIHF